MAPDERINKLQEEVAQLTAQNKEIMALLQNVGGHQRMYHAAVDSLIISHPFPPALRPVLVTLLAKMDAIVISTAQSDDHVAGAQASQERLMAVLEESERLHGLEDAPESQG